VKNSSEKKNFYGHLMTKNVLNLLAKSVD